MSLRIDTHASNGGTRVSISGVIDENADFAPLFALTGNIEVNLRGVKRINSFGVREWIDAMRKLTDIANPSFVEVSSAAIDQLNMIQEFLGHAPVRSFCAPLVCPHCDAQETRVYNTRDCVDIDVCLPPTDCPSCARGMELDDVDDKYLLFLREPTQVA